MRKTKSINNVALRALLCILLFLLCLVAFIPSVTTQAENITLSGVLSDLKKDLTFDVVKYPVKDNDYSLNVIQIAEGKSGGLYVYVYQPSNEGKRRLATSINISNGINDNKRYFNYALEFDSVSDTLYKYKVVDYALTDEKLRYYDISSIYREFDPRIDEKPEDTSLTVSEVAYAVGQLWSACTVNNVVYYSMEYVDVIEIVEKYCGTMRYDAYSMNPFEKDCDSHFVAFSTDLPIDKLLSADVSFVRQIESISSAFTGSKTELSDPKQITRTVTYSEKVEYTTGVFVKDKYEWHRIETVKEFLKANDVGKDLEKKVEKMQWVLRFYESDYKSKMNFADLVAGTEVGEVVSEVTILRLEFNLDGVTYNLGAVDDKTTGSDIWISNQEPEREIPWWVYLLIAIIILVIGIPLLIMFAPSVLAAIGKILLLLLKAIWWLICLPFRAIATLIHKIKGDGGG